LTSDENLNMLPCAHIFHSSCIRGWLVHKGMAAYCPLCKHPVQNGGTASSTAWREHRDGAPESSSVEGTELGPLSHAQVEPTIAAGMEAGAHSSHNAGDAQESVQVVVSRFDQLEAHVAEASAVELSHAVASRSSPPRGRTSSSRISPSSSSSTRVAWEPDGQSSELDVDSGHHADQASMVEHLSEAERVRPSSSVRNDLALSRASSGEAEV